MVTEQDIKNNESTDTPIGLASWCWFAEFNFNAYCESCNDIAITPISQEDFEYICNWWNEQLAKSTYLN